MREAASRGRCRRLKRLACHRFYPVFSYTLQFNTSCICRCQNPAVTPLQVIFVSHFQSDDSLIITTGKSNHLRSKLIIRIVPFKIFIHFHSGKFHFPYLIPCLLINIRLNPFHGRHLLHPLSNFRFLHAQTFAQFFYHHLWFLNLAMYDRNCTHRPVCCQHCTIRIDNFSSGCLNLSFPLVKIFRLFLIILRIKNHQIDHSSYQTQNHQKCRQKHNHNFPFIICFISQYKKPQKRCFYQFIRTLPRLFIFIFNFSC